MSTAQQVPLEEQLRSVPKGGIAVIEKMSNIRPWIVESRTNVPYGRMCHEAANEIARLQAALKEAASVLGLNGCYEAQERARAALKEATP